MQSSPAHMDPDPNMMSAELRDAALEYLLSPASKVALLTSGNENGNGYEVFPMNWPAGLPNPAITRHLYAF